MKRPRIGMIFDQSVRPDTTGGYCLRAMASLADVTHVPPQDLDKIQADQFDLFINIDDGLRYRLPSHLHPCIWWAIDTHLDLNWYAEKSPDFDLVFAAQKDGASQLSSLLGRKVEWLPLACDPSVHRKHSVPKKWNISFIGNLFPGLRTDFVEMISRKFSDVLIDRRFFDDMAKAYSESKIVFNQSIRNDINMRVFEAVATGSFLLTNDLSENGLSEVFDAGTHLDTFRSAEELLDKAKYYLTHEDVREKLAAQGRQHALEHHTYRQRMERLLAADIASPRQPVSTGRRTDYSFRPGASVADLTSIVIVTHNQLEFTRQCLDSLRAHTNQPYELIVVDNGSTDGTPEYLNDAPDVLLIENNSNRGFPAAANQGIRLSRGKQVVLLNNDTILAPDWLEPLLAALRNDSSIGLVGPSSNAVSGTQQISIDYRSIDQMHEFTRQLAVTNKGRFEEVDRLIGFCLLIRREVIDRVGLLDEQFGLGCFEDDDYTLRAISAGFRVVIARDAFVHHFGGATFSAIGIDYGSLLRENQKKFIEKWTRHSEPVEKTDARTGNGNQTGCLLLITPLNETHQNGGSLNYQRFKALAKQKDVMHFGPGAQGYRPGMPIDEAIKVIGNEGRIDWIICESVSFDYEFELLTGLSDCLLPKAYLLARPWIDRERQAAFINEQCFRTVFLLTSIDVAFYQANCPNVDFHFLPPPIDTSVFRDYGEEKQYDVLLYDVGEAPLTPAHKQLSDELDRHPEWQAKHLTRLKESDSGDAVWEENLAREINRAWICIVIGNEQNVLTLSQFEIAACKSVIAGNLSLDARPFLGQDVIDLKSGDDTSAVIQRLSAALADKDNLLCRARRGHQVVHRELSMEYFATRIIEILSESNHLKDLEGESSRQSIPGIAQLRKQYPWTDESPKGIIFPEVEGWLADGAYHALKASLSDQTKVVVELGSWLGLSTRHIADCAPNAQVIAVDHFKGSDEHRKEARLASHLSTLFEAFQAKCWNYRHQILPLRASTIEGMRLIAEAGIEPDLIYVDASHDYESVKADLKMAWTFFPKAVLVGDDFADHSVRRAVDELARDFHVQPEAIGQSWPAWRLKPSPVSISHLNPRDSSQLIRPMASDPASRFALQYSVKLSLCMIVRDNENTIGPALESIRPWVDEMIVVDTGSQDRTPDICREMGAEVHFFPWCDDFAAARNESLRHAHGEWLFWMDSDDTIPPDCGQRLRNLAHGPKDPNHLGYVMQVHCPSGNGYDGSAVTVVDHVKLIRNDPRIRFEGRIHEQLMSSIRAVGGDVGWTDIYVDHSGSDHSPATRLRKLERDFHLLRLDCQERPNHPFVRFNLGMTYADAGMYGEAITELEYCLKLSNPAESHVRKAYALLTSAQSGAGDFARAWEVCQLGLGLFPDDCELRFRKAILLQEQGDLSGSEQIYRELLGCETSLYFVSLDSGLRGYKSRHNLAVVLEQMGRFSEAASQWEIITREEPNYSRGWRGLGECLISSGHSDDAVRLANSLVELDRPEALQAEGNLLHARIFESHSLKDRAIDSARKAIAISRDKDILSLASNLAINLDRAEVAASWLRDLTELDPMDASAWHNYATAQCRLGHFEESIEAYQRSLQIRPNSLSTILQSIQAFKIVGEPELAFSLCREAMTMFPASRELLQESAALSMD